MSKYLRVMADYCSTGLWNKLGSNVDVEDYDLSDETKLALAIWCRWYEHNDDYKPDKDRKLPLFDLKSFSQQGLVVAKLIKRDLPDYEIVYFDEYALSIMDSGVDHRLLYEYPV